MENPDGGSFTLAGGFEYLLVGTPVSVDGDLTDWDSRYELVVNTGAGSNTLKNLSASFDSTNLYIAVVEDIPAGNGVVAWLDVNVGSGEGITNIASSLTDTFGSLDNWLSSVNASITATDFEVDAALGSIDHAAVANTFADEAGARDFGTDGLAGDLFDFAWLRSTVSPGAGDENLEMAVPLTSIFPGGIPTTGQTVGIFVTATASNGNFPMLQDWVLPDQLVFGTTSRLIADVITLRIFPDGQY